MSSLCSNPLRPNRARPLPAATTRTPKDTSPREITRKPSSAKAHITYRNYSKIIVFPPPSSFVHHHLSAMAGRNFLKEPLEGVETLHAMGIMHRDPRPNNMLDPQRWKEQEVRGSGEIQLVCLHAQLFFNFVSKVPSLRIYINGVEQCT